MRPTLLIIGFCTDFIRYNRHRHCRILIQRPNGRRQQPVYHFQVLRNRVIGNKLFILKLADPILRTSRNTRFRNTIHLQHIFVSKFMEERHFPKYTRMVYFRIALKQQMYVFPLFRVFRLVKQQCSMRINSIFNAITYNHIPCLAFLPYIRVTHICADISGRMPVNDRIFLVFIPNHQTVIGRESYANSSWLTTGCIKQFRNTFIIDNGTSRPNTVFIIITIRS